MTSYFTPNNQLDLFSKPTETFINPNVMASVHVPDQFTKSLAIHRFDGKRKIRLSTNLLEVMGWTKGIRTSMESLGEGKGIEITCNTKGKTQIYQRQYKRRKNNPFETQIDIQSQNLIDSSIYNYTEELHFSIRRGKILVTPLANRTFSIRRAMQNLKELEAFVAMSSGIDQHCIQKAGFGISGLLEYRPQEKRDKIDYTETGIVNAMAQGYIRNVFNEDISKINWQQVKSTMENSEPVAFAHLSLQCDDFSVAKAKKLKDRSMETLDTTIDLVYDGLRMIEEIQPGVVLVENVEGFANSQAGQILSVKLRKWGYHVSEGVFKGSEMGGLTSRKRYYLVASIFPNFEFPSETVSELSAWDLVQEEIHKLRDSTNNKAVIDGIKTDRIRFLKKGDKFSPTILKSQNRMAKDSLYIQDGNKILFPNEALLRKLSGFPESINLNCVGETIGSEIIGQSIDYPMHDRIIESVYKHINTNRQNSKIIRLAKN